MITINHLVDLVVEIAEKRIGKKHIPGPQGVRGRNSDNGLILESLGWAPARPLRAGLAYLRRFEHFKGSKCLILLRWTPEGRHYSRVGGAGALAVILGGGWAGSSSFSLFSKRLSSGSGSV